MLHRHKNITLIGTSHIAKHSVKEIAAAYTWETAFVAVELDENRAYALEHHIETKPSLALVRRVGVGGFLFAIIGRALQKKLGNLVGMQPGAEMLAAMRLARKNNKTLLFIDKPIEQTLRSISRVPFREKARIAGDILFGLFGKKVRVDVRRVPDEALIAQLLDLFQQRYPQFFKALVGERNTHMARVLHTLQHNNPSAEILAVVGAGHAQGILRELSRLDRQREYV